MTSEITNRPCPEDHYGLLRLPLWLFPDLQLGMETDVTLKAAEPFRAQPRASASFDWLPFVLK
jgi:hypothetical protein